MRANVIRIAKPFEWELAGLFHDIGYHAEIASNVLNRFGESICEIKKDLCFQYPTKKVRFKIMPANLDKLTNDKSCIDLIQQRLDEWQLRIDAKREYRRSTNNRSGNVRVDHGVISSLVLLQTIDLLYQNVNPHRQKREFPVGELDFNEEYFENDVVSACSAIFIHNLPKEAFKDSKIDCSIAPLPFLLRLSDNLQQWERPSLDDPQGIPASLFDFAVENGKIEYFTQIPIDKREWQEKIDKMKIELKDSLVIPDWLNIH